MDMDIVKRIKPFKASYDKLSLKIKIIVIFILLSLVSIIVPHHTVEAESSNLSYLKFEIGDYEDFLNEIELTAKEKHNHEQTVAELKKQIRLADKVKQYLITKNSPLAPYASTLVQQNNWKKIIALSNAESSMCRRYPTTTANCWGVGGSNLWNMGNDLGQGVITMNRFLNNYPLRTKTKYTAMSFDQMNGLYKQPARDHWVVNNETVYDQLTKLEQSL